MNSDVTFPHDYRVVAGSVLKPTIVGGQAVHLWAITFLEAGDAPKISTKYGSGDMDILSGPKVVEFLKTLEPLWRVDKIPLRIFGHGLDAVAHGTAPDGRKLLVEVLKHVKGLDTRDLSATVEIEYAGATFKVLDPIALLKAKAANVRDLDQVGPPPRHDLPHLQLVARCVPLYLKNIHTMAIGKPEAERAAAETFSRAFATLTHRHTIAGLKKAGIDRVSLMPAEFATSMIEKIRNAYVHQFPRLRGENPD